MRIGPYEIVDTLGRGGMGVVYRARGPDGRVVALKVLTASDAPRLARFAREQRLLSAFTESDGFVPLLDASSAPQGAYLVMPLIEGGTLRSRLESGALTIDDTVAIGRKLARALGNAHSRGIVHRDVKPENILFTTAGEPLLTDLGIAKHFDREAPGGSQSLSLSVRGTFHGTVGYMSPEQMGDAASVGPPADVFALGCVLQECLTGAPTFHGETPVELLMRVAGGTREPLRQLRPEVPAWLVEAIDRALATDPAHRFPDGATLEGALESGPKRRSRTVPMGPVVLVGLGVVALGVAALGLALRPRSGPSTPEAPAVANSSSRPSPSVPSGWYERLPSAGRPPLPLPKGIRLGASPGEYVNERDDSVLLYVPAATFTMGRRIAGDPEPDRDPHEVTLDHYFIGKHEVTTEQFRKFVEATRLVTQAESMGGGGRQHMEWFPGQPDPSYVAREVVGSSWRSPSGHGEARPRDPVVNVTWREAKAYCDWAGLALPTEAQWELAASGGEGRAYPWGSEEDPGRANVATDNKSGDDRDDGTRAVGSYPGSQARCGALDLCGNVFEWCWDHHAPYGTAAERNPTGPTRLSVQGWQVARGGSFRRTIGIGASFIRNSVGFDQSLDDVGFRVAYDYRQRPPRER